MAEFLDKDGVLYLWNKCKELFGSVATPTKAGIISTETQWFGGAKGAENFSVGKTTDPYFSFYRNGTAGGSENLLGRILLSTPSSPSGSGNNEYVSGKYRFRQNSFASNGVKTNYYEVYDLPTTDLDRSSNGVYGIYTTKNNANSFISSAFTNASNDVTLTDGMKYAFLVLMGRADSSNRNYTCVVPTANITTTAVRYAIASETGHFSVTLTKSNTDVIMSFDDTTDTANGKISRVYGMLYSG